MTKLRLAGVMSAAFIALGLLATSAWAPVVDYFLKIDGIKGEAVESQHQGWIEMQSLQWGVGSQAGGAGKTSVHELVITKEMDSASPSLFRAASTGQHFPQIVIEVVARGTMQHYALDDAIIASVRRLPGGGRPMEEITLRFGRSTESVQGHPCPTPACLQAGVSSPRDPMMRTPH
jgi:type VI secretion system secreted protein Hcp